MDTLQVILETVYQNQDSVKSIMHMLWIATGLIGFITGNVLGNLIKGEE